MEPDLIEIEIEDEIKSKAVRYVETKKKHQLFVQIHLQKDLKKKLKLLVLQDLDDDSKENVADKF